MRIRRELKPVIATYPFVWRNEDEDSIFEHDLHLGYKISKLIFDDLAFDTPNPILPLWYRIILWFRGDN
jgi:hypothetical protein